MLMLNEGSLIIADTIYEGPAVAASDYGCFYI